MAMDLLNELTNNTMIKESLLDIGFTDKGLSQISLNENLSMPVDTWAASWLGLCVKPEFISTIQAYALIKWWCEISKTEENWQRRAEAIQFFNGHELFLINDAKKQRVSVSQSKNASKPRKEMKSYDEYIGLTRKETLLKFKDDFSYNQGKVNGWQKQAAVKFEISTSMITRILKRIAS